MKTYLIVGSSRGIGETVAKHFTIQGNRVIGISRTKPKYGDWIQADISSSEGVRKVEEGIADTSLDALLFMGGVWESNAFTEAFSFQASSDEESRFVISVNLLAPIEITRVVAKNLSKTQNPRAIYIGALSGLDHLATHEVANTASKFGLRGAIQALRLAYRNKGIGFTVINPGNVATEEVIEDIREGRSPEQVPIPLEDLCGTIEWILSLSSNTEVGDVNLMQTNS